MPRICRLLILGVSSLALLAAPGFASAAVVTNGDFETGNLFGWTVNNSPSSLTNKWYAYTGTSSPLNGNPVAAPPQGKYAAVTDQSGPGTRLLYQDIVVPSGSPQFLSMFVYYHVFAPISSPDSLNSATPNNEQYRIDVMKPTAALDSIAPADVLLTVFRTVTGNPETLAPTQKVADLTAFAGQTVRLRLAEVDNEDVFNASADAISVQSSAFTIGQAELNKKKGTAELPVTVPWDGTVTLTGTGVVQQSSAPASKSVAVGAGTTNLLVKATGKKRRKLNKKGKAKVNVTVTYTLNGLSPATQQATVKLKRKKKKKA